MEGIDFRLQELVLKTLYEMNEGEPGSKVDFNPLLEFLRETYSELSEVLTPYMLERNLIFLYENKWIIFSRYVGRPKRIYITKKGIKHYLSPICEHYSCFIAYGEPDKEFTEKLVKNLEIRGVKCWYYSADSTPGERTWHEIGQKRRAADKMIVLCSAYSLIRDGFLKEIEDQIDEDPDKIIPISLDTLWKQDGFRVMRGTKDLKPFLLDRNYADFSDESQYEDSFKRLLKALIRQK